MKNIINCPFIPIAKRAASHRGAQGVMYGDQIRQKYGECDVNYGGEISDHNAYDNLWVYHGNDWSGGLNMFGGVYGFPYVQNTVNFSQFKGKVYSIGIDFPPYHEMVRNKLESAKKEVQPEWHQVDLKNLERMFNEAERVDYPNITNNLVVGDSHSICMYRPGWTVNSIPFKTLNGALNEGLKSFIDIKADKIQFYFGNIDIRHHVCRLNADIEKLCDRYIEQVSELGGEIFELLPIENESRKIPQSGYYKGKPFYGSWEERNEARNKFNDYIEKEYGLIRWTQHLYNEKGELDFKYMEKPQSIHLSREFYPYWNGMETNSLEDFFE
tara:strand:+ start:186 stop:1166 length:981 start_codon:yes stop_codon:yes gene_type:complete